MAHGIVVSSYSPLGSDFSPLLENDIVKEIAEKHSVPPATILVSLQASFPNTTGWSPVDLVLLFLHRHSSSQVRHQRKDQKCVHDI